MAKHIRRHWKKYFIIGIILLNAIFTGIVLYIFMKIQQEPDTLIQYWFLFTGTELVAMAGVETTKAIKHKKHNNDSEDSV